MHDDKCIPVADSPSLRKQGDGSGTALDRELRSVGPDPGFQGCLQAAGPRPERHDAEGVLCGAEHGLIGLDVNPYAPVHWIHEEGKLMDLHTVAVPLSLGFEGRVTPEERRLLLDTVQMVVGRLFTDTEGLPVGVQEVLTRRKLVAVFAEIREV